MDFCCHKCKLNPIVLHGLCKECLSALGSKAGSTIQGTTFADWPVISVGGDDE